MRRKRRLCQQIGLSVAFLVALFMMIRSVGDRVPASAAERAPPSHDGSSAIRRGKYVVLHHFLVAEAPKSAPSSAVTIATHSTLSMLENILPLAERWGGLISVSVYARGYNELHDVIAIIFHIRACSRVVKNLVTFHLFYDVGLSDNNGAIDEISRQVFSCTNFTYLHHQSTPSQYTDYPINVARNIAMETVTSEFVLVLDMELLPNESLLEQFEKFTENDIKEFDGKKVAFVLPAFEISEEKAADVPRNKAELQSMVAAGSAQVFHINRCWQCHKFPAYSKWIAETSAGEHNSPLETYHISKYVPEWEPVFITYTRYHPTYDERFVGRGFNKQALALEMCYMGFVFGILNKAFVVHRGFAEWVENKAPSAVSERNYNEFISDMRSKFGSSRHKRCRPYLNKSERKVGASIRD